MRNDKERERPLYTPGPHRCQFGSPTWRASQPCPDRRKHFLRAWVQESAPSIDILAVDGDTKFTEFATTRFDVRVRTLEQRRHPGGDTCLDGSNRAVMHCDHLHASHPPIPGRPNCPA